VRKTIVDSGFVKWKVVNHSVRLPSSDITFVLNGKLEFGFAKWNPGDPNIRGSDPSIALKICRREPRMVSYLKEATCSFSVIADGEECARTEILQDGIPVNRSLESQFICERSTEGKGPYATVTNGPVTATAGVFALDRGEAPQRRVRPSSLVINRKPPQATKPAQPPSAAVGTPDIVGRPSIPAASECPKSDERREASVLYTEAQLEGFCKFLETLTCINLSAYSVVGDYVRFDPKSRDYLKRKAHEIQGIVEKEHWDNYNNVLISGFPGSGKNEFVNAIAHDLCHKFPSLQWVYRIYDLSKQSQEELAVFLRGLSLELESGKSVVSFIDEVDSKDKEEWPFEDIIEPLKKWNKDSGNHIIWFAAGSRGDDLEQFKGIIRVRHKGPDLLSRFPHCEIRIPPLDIFEKMVIAAAQLRCWASTKKKTFDDVETTTFLWFANSSDARQIDDKVKRAVDNLPPTAKTLYYRDCFSGANLSADRFRDANLRFFKMLEGYSAKIEV